VKLVINILELRQLRKV